MSSNVLCYLSLLTLDRKAMKSLRITDTYSLHRIVYNLFPDVRDDTQKKSGESSGILWVEHNSDIGLRQIFILSNRIPCEEVEFGAIKTKEISQSFVEHDKYKFNITLNPSKKTNGKIVAITARDEIIQWATNKSINSWGFEIEANSLEVQINQLVGFQKGEHSVVHNSVSLNGVLRVVELDKFIHSFTSGIGRGKTFGLGLLQIVPIAI